MTKRQICKSDQRPVKKAKVIGTKKDEERKMTEKVKKRNVGLFLYHEEIPAFIQFGKRPGEWVFNEKNMPRRREYLGRVIDAIPFKSGKHKGRVRVLRTDLGNKYTRRFAPDSDKSSWDKKVYQTSKYVRYEFVRSPYPMQSMPLSMNQEAKKERAARELMRNWVKKKIEQKFAPPTSQGATDGGLWFSRTQEHFNSLCHKEYPRDSVSSRFGGQKY